MQARGGSWGGPRSVPPPLHSRAVHGFCWPACGGRILRSGILHGFCGRRPGRMLAQPLSAAASRQLRFFNVILGPCRCPRPGPSSAAGPSESSLGHAGRGQLCGTGGVSPARSPRFSGKGPVNRWTPAPAAPRYLRPNSTVTRSARAAGRSSAIHSHSGPESCSTGRQSLELSQGRWHWHYCGTRRLGPPGRRPHARLQRAPMPRQGGPAGLPARGSAGSTRWAGRPASARARREHGFRSRCPNTCRW